MLDHVINITGLVVALVALAIAIYSWVTATRAARNDVLAQVRDWGGEVVDFFASARALCQLATSRIDPAELESRRAELGFQASALLDRGRFFFPNWRGERPRILDLLMVAYELVPGIAKSDNERRSNGIHYLQVVFVSAIKEAVNFSRSPASVKKYEERLATIRVQPLPNELIEMTAGDHYFKLDFDARSLDELPPRDPGQNG